MRTRLTVLAAACCLVLAACGGDADTGGSAGAEPDQEAESAETSETPTPEVGPEETMEPAFTASSSDGVVTLDVPAGAVPAGTTITIEATTAPEGTDAAYEFGPDGLEFAEPATLSWTLGEPAESTAYLVTSISGGETEVLQGVEIDVANGTATVTTPVHHFSTITIREINLTIGQTSPGPTVPLHDTFDFEFGIVGGGDSAIQIPTELSATVDLTPASGGVEGATTQGGEWTLSAPTTWGFTCEPVGPFIAAAHARVKLDWVVNGAEPQRVNDVPAFVILKTECVDGPTGTLLTLGDPIYDDAEQLDTALLVDGDGTTVSITVSEDDIPADGVLGVTFTAPDNAYFTECNFDRRGFSSGCNGFDRALASVGSFDATEVANDDGTTTLPLPFDLFEVGADGLSIRMGDMTIPVETLTVDTFGPDGSFAQATLDIDEFVDAIIP